MKMIKKKGKVAIFHCGFIYSGGGERIVLEEARHLKRRGWQVEVYAPTLNAKKCYPEMVKDVGVKMFFPSLIEQLPFRNGLRMITSCFLAPVLAFKFRDTDIFLGANQPGAWLAFVIAKINRKPYLVYLNQPNRLLYPRPVDKKYGWYTTEKDYQILDKIFKGILRTPLSKLDRLSITSGSELLVNGAYIGSVIENIYGKETIEVPAGAYAQLLDQTLLQIPERWFQGKITINGFLISKPYALITNRHDPQKRFDLVIEAFAQMIQEYPKASLIIPGPFTDFTPTLIKLVRRLKLGKKVVFTAQIPEADLQKLYQHAAVYCYPAPEEDFGLGPLEAGGWGVPTVAWKHGGPTVTVADGVTGFLAKPYEISDFASKMLQLFQDRNLRIKMGKKAWIRTRDIFSWQRHTHILENFLLKYLNNR